MAAHAAVVRDDIASLLRMGAPLAQVETLYGAAAVRAVAREEFAERRDVKLGADLIGRSSSIRVAHLGDAYFVEELLEALEADPPEEFMDDVMLCRLVDPVVLSSGHVVDRTTALDDEGALRFTYCPFSREELKKDVYPCVGLHKRLTAWKLERLNECVDVAKKLVGEELYDDAERAFACAEDLLADVRETTYVAVAKALADVQRASPRCPPERRVACWRRLARAASSDAERAALKRAAAAETARALEELADRGDAAAGRRVADAFVARFPPPFEDSTIADRVLRAYEATSADELWKLRRRVLATCDDEGAFLEREGLRGDEAELLGVASAPADAWELLEGAEWLVDAATTRCVATGFVGAARLRHGDLNPRPGQGWVLEVCFRAVALDDDAERNVVFSHLADGRGWEVRCGRTTGVGVVFATERSSNAFAEFAVDDDGADDREMCLEVWRHVLLVHNPVMETLTLAVDGRRLPPAHLDGAFLPCADHRPTIGRSPARRDCCFVGHVAFAAVTFDALLTDDAVDAAAARLAETRLRVLSAARDSLG